jgi:hypothetical protein
LVELRIAQDVFARQFEDELVVLDLSRGEYYALNSTAALLWRGIEEGRSTEQLARDLAAEFAVDVTQAAQDLESFAVGLRSMGLLVAA